MTDTQITGSIQSKNGKFYAVLNYKDEAGKRKQKWISTNLPVKNNRRNAGRFLQQAISEFRVPVAPEYGPELSGNILYSDYLAQWLSICKPAWATKTYCGYAAIINNQLGPYFRERGIPLGRIRAQHIQAYYRAKLEQDGVKANTVLRHHAIVHKSLKDAVRMDLIPSNPADKVILPKKEKFVGSFYTSEEIEALLTAAKGTTLETPILLTTYYGLRRSEVTGLRWSSIDFKTKTISIENKVVQITGDGKTQLIASQVMKTDSSMRTLPLISKVEAHLQLLKKQQLENEKLFGDTYDHEYDGYICRFVDGCLISPNYITKTFTALLEANQLRRIRFHDLRHYYASMAHLLGVPDQ